MATDRRLLPLLALVLFLCAARPSLAQPSNGTSHNRHTTGGFTPTTVIVLAVLISAFVLLTLFSIYVNSCSRLRPPPQRRGAAPGHQPAVRRGAHGLDRELIESFPTAVYGDVKARVGVAARSSGPLECAVCLAEFADRDELRVLPLCCHVFHPGCIDPWLAGAVTCPLCRADLTAPQPPATVNCVLTTARGEAAMPEEEEREEACLVAAPESSLAVSGLGATRPHEFHYRRTQSAMEAPDRHTLRLPEHVMKELAAVRCHRRAASLAGYPDSVEKQAPTWMASFWKSVSWQRQSRKESDAAGEEHGGTRRVVPITGALAEVPSRSEQSGEEEEEKPDSDALNRV